MNHFSNMPDSTITLELEWDGGFGKSAKVVEGYGSDINFAKERKDPNSPFYEADNDPFKLKHWASSVRQWKRISRSSPSNYKIAANFLEVAEYNLKEAIHAAEIHLQSKKYQRGKRYAA